MLENNNQLDSMPTELLTLILGFLGPGDLARLAAVSRRWRDIIYDICFCNPVRYAHTVNGLLEHAIVNDGTLGCLAKDSKAKAMRRLDEAMRLDTRMLLATYYIQKQRIERLPERASKAIALIASSAKRNVFLITRLVITMYKHELITKNDIFNFVNYYVLKESHYPLGAKLHRLLEPYYSKQQIIGYAEKTRYFASGEYRELKSLLDQSMLEYIFCRILNRCIKRYINRYQLGDEASKLEAVSAGNMAFKDEDKMLDYIYLQNVNNPAISITDKAVAIILLKDSYTEDEARKHIAKLLFFTGKEQYCYLEAAILKIFPFADVNTKKLIFDYFLDFYAPKPLKSNKIFEYLPPNGVLSQVDYRYVFEKIMKTKALFTTDRRCYYTTRSLIAILKNLTAQDVIRVYNSIKNEFMFLMGNKVRFDFYVGFDILLKGLPFADSQFINLSYDLICLYLKESSPRKEQSAQKLLFRLLPRLSEEQIKSLYALSVSYAKEVSSVVHKEAISFLEAREYNIHALENIVLLPLLESEKDSCRALHYMLGDNINCFYNKVYEKMRGVSNVKHLLYVFSGFAKILLDSFEVSNQEIPDRFSELILSPILRQGFVEPSVTGYLSRLHRLPKRFLQRQDVLDPYFRMLSFYAKRGPVEAGDKARLIKIFSEILNNISEEQLQSLLEPLLEAVKQNGAFLIRPFASVFNKRRLWRYLDYDVTNIMNSTLDCTPAAESFNQLLESGLITFPRLIINNTDSKCKLEYLAYLFKKCSQDVQLKIVKSVFDLNIEKVVNNNYEHDADYVFKKMFNSMRGGMSDLLFGYLVEQLESEDFNRKLRAVDAINQCGVVTSSQMNKFVLSNWGFDNYSDVAELSQKIFATIAELSSKNDLFFEEACLIKVINNFAGHDNFDSCYFRMLRSKAPDMDYNPHIEKFIKSCEDYSLENVSKICELVQDNYGIISPQCKLSCLSIISSCANWPLINRYRGEHIVKKLFDNLTRDYGLFQGLKVENKLELLSLLLKIIKNFTPPNYGLYESAVIDRTLSRLNRLSGVVAKERLTAFKSDKVKPIIQSFRVKAGVDNVISLILPEYKTKEIPSCQDEGLKFLVSKAKVG